MKHWIQSSIKPSVVRRSMRVALIVGTILVIINQGDKLVEGRLDSVIILKILLTYLVPYLVATYAAVAALKQ